MDTAEIYCGKTWKNYWISQKRTKTNKISSFKFQPYPSFKTQNQWKRRSQSVGLWRKFTLATLQILIILVITLEHITNITISDILSKIILCHRPQTPIVPLILMPLLKSLVLSIPNLSIKCTTTLNSHQFRSSTTNETGLQNYQKIKTTKILLKNNWELVLSLYWKANLNSLSIASMGPSLAFLQILNKVSWTYLILWQGL